VGVSLDDSISMCHTQVRTAAEALCAVPWTTVESTMDGVDDNTPSERLRGRCFDGALVTTLLGESGGLGYGLPERRAVMTFVDEVAGMEVEWTLGVALTLADPEPLLQKVRVWPSQLFSTVGCQQRQPW